MKVIFILCTLFGVISCSSFKAERVNANRSDEKAMEITDKWVSRDTENVVSEIIEKMNKHRGFKKYIRRSGKMPAVFIGEVQNLTSEPYFPINDINDEFLNAISETGDFVLVDAGSREKLLKEITYQNDGMVNPMTAKKIGKQTGADLMIFGNVFMEPQRRDGKTIKEYRVNIYMTDIQKGIEVVRTRVKLYKYSEQDKSGW